MSLEEMLPCSPPTTASNHAALSAALSLPISVDEFGEGGAASARGRIIGIAESSPPPPPPLLLFPLSSARLRVDPPSERALSARVPRTFLPAAFIHCIHIREEGRLRIGPLSSSNP